MLILILPANLVLSAFLTGLIWFVQVVHYPIFRKVPASRFLAWHAAHTHTGQVVAVPMLIELVLAGWLVIRPFPGGAQWISYAACGCVPVIWAVTFLIAIPLHNQLAAGGYNKEIIDSLVRVNWLRTILWTIRTGILFYLLYLQLHPCTALPATADGFKENTTDKIGFLENNII